MDLKKYLPKPFKYFANRFVRFLNVLMMMITLYSFSSQTFKFSKRKFLPSKNNKINRLEARSVPYELIENESFNLPNLDEVDAVGIGSSFDLNNLIKISRPTFLLSFFDSLKVDKYGNISYFFSQIKCGHKLNYKENEDYSIYKNPNIFYVCSDLLAAKKLNEHGHNIFFINTYTKDIENKIVWGNDKINFKKFLKIENSTVITLQEKIMKYSLNNTDTKWAQTGSVIPFLAAISFCAKKINVYGWDFFLKKSPEKMSQIEILKNMYSNKIDFLRSNTHFEEALINFYYGYYFSINKKFNIYSYMGKLQKHKKLIDKIENVFFN